MVSFGIACYMEVLIDSCVYVGMSIETISCINIYMFPLRSVQLVQTVSCSGKYSVLPDNVG